MRFYINPQGLVEEEFLTENGKLQDLKGRLNPKEELDNKRVIVLLIKSKGFDSAVIAYNKENYDYFTQVLGAQEYSVKLSKILKIPNEGFSDYYREHIK